MTMTTTERAEALNEMQRAVCQLLKNIEHERAAVRDDWSSWDGIEAALLAIRGAWEEAKACEILEQFEGRANHSGDQECPLRPPRADTLSFSINVLINPQQ